jgi:hypothetical protein
MDTRNQSLVHAVLACQLRLRNIANGAAATYLDYISFGQFCHAVRLTARRSAFLKLIQIVIRNRSYKQMVGIAARRIITTVANNLSSGNRAVMDFIREAMGAVIQYATVAKTAIAVLILKACPLPAAVRFNDVRPEAFKQWNLAALNAAKRSLNLILALRPRVESLTASLASVWYFKSGHGEFSLSENMLCQGSFTVSSVCGPFCILPQ